LRVIPIVFQRKAYAKRRNYNGQSSVLYAKIVNRIRNTEAFNNSVKKLNRAFDSQTPKSSLIFYRH